MIQDQIALEKARATFNRLSTMDVLSEAHLQGVIDHDIKEPLAAIGQPLSALDPSGKKSDAQIERQIQQAAKSAMKMKGFIAR